VLIVRDMREIRAMEEALERSRRMAALGRMAAGIAHEIRNPLGTLRGFAQFFRRRPDEDAAAREYADLMVGEVDRLNRTVSALLQFSRPREPEFAGVELGELLQRTARLMEEDVAAHQVVLKVDQPAEPVVFSADPDLLTQVLINLLQNGLAATQEDGKIRLGGSRENQEIRLWVQDSGRGMTAEERERMFDPFYTTRKEGTGLGLAVVQQIIEQHRGRIEVESAPGEGTRVEVILPAGEVDDKV
jgi:two-component system sensor histidine kinase HydH